MKDKGDNAGNILSKTEYDHTDTANSPDGTTVIYRYDNTNWGDLLTSYQVNNNAAVTITSDNIGNMTQHGAWKYEWAHGRELQKMTYDDGNNETANDIEWEFVYNADGLRTKRTNGSTTYIYVYNGSSLSQMTIVTGTGDTAVTKTLNFVYDASGSPMAVVYDNVAYYYVTNLQGDVIAILDSTGTAVVQYSYDAWGKLLKTSGNMTSTLGAQNPLRYRGYVYDDETTLYYLQSRYYNPAIGRFINADVDASTGHGLLGSNMFVYCGNNPVNYTDASGQDWWHWAAAAAIVAVAAVAVIATAGGVAGAALAITAVANGVAVSGTATTVAAGVFVGSSVALAGSAYYAATESASLEEFAQYGEEALISTAVGGTLGGIEAYSLPGHNCFIAGTLVQIDQGSIPIENVSVGTMVWAWDEETGDVALKQVVETYVNETYELVHVSVNGEEIIVTPTHPFYSPVKGWTQAVHLRAGDILVLVNGEYVVVEKVQHEILEAPVTVYNFQVEDFHTYFVYGILVHNMCPEKGVGNKGWQGDKTWRENVNTVAEGGTITELKGGVPTQAQGIRLINQAGGEVVRIEGAHNPPNPHTYPHINYVVGKIKGTLRILQIE